MLPHGNRRYFVLVFAAIVILAIAVGIQVARPPVERPGVVRINTVAATAPSSSLTASTPFTTPSAPAAYNGATDPDVEARLVSLAADDANRSRQRMQDRSAQGTSTAPKSVEPAGSSANSAAAPFAWGP